MARVPLTAKEQLRRALELGHELSVVTRTRPDFPDAPPKFIVNCTCGYASTARRSMAAVNSTLAWHLGKALAEFDEESPEKRSEMRRNGVAGS